ncbi:MAG: SUMF1/EgtB/PvdO family nonheme iron enzyme, partial [Kiritimatiellae bacterium]|nr:SUMF1/EgtB/PvdO family nonheme iron enzyme [Kiritimatiellia bacterium]
MGAGIGGHGGGYVGSGGTITINGGVVTATGSTGSAGIGGGGGSFGGAGGTVTVNGGVVTATGGDGAAGIGGGLGVFVDEGGAGGTLTIIGGTVTAIAGKKDNFAQGTAPQAIGQGQQATNEGSLDFTGMKVYASEDATEPVAAGDRMAACRGGWAKLTVCAPHAVASCQWCGMKSFLVRKLFDGKYHGTNTYSTVELTVYSEAAKNPDARGSCLTYVIEGGGIDCTDNVDENGQRAKLNGVYGIEQANHSMAVFNDVGWAYIKADLKENSTIRVTGTFGPYQPEYAAEAPNGMDKRKTLSTTGLLQGQTFYVIERDPGYFYAGPTGYVYTDDDEAADPRVDAGGMAATQALTMDIRDETDYPPPKYDNNPEEYPPATIPEGALFLKGVTTGAPTTVFVVNEFKPLFNPDTLEVEMPECNASYDGEGHDVPVDIFWTDYEGLQVRLNGDDWTGRYALGDSTGPTNAWSGVKPVFTNVCDETVWVEAVLEGWSGTTSGVVRIRPAALAITAKDQTCDFDGRPHGEDRATYTDPAEIAAKVEVSGLVPGDGLASVTLDGTRTAPGTEPIIPSGATVTNAIGDVTFNYAVSYTNGTLTILGPPPEVMDVTAAPTGGSWQGKVDIAFNVTNDVARGLPGWNAPVLSIVATDHLTGSNYVADVSALSARAPYQLADALAGSNGTHEVTWDFTAQGIDFSSTNVTFTVAYLRMPDYCVIDLSGEPGTGNQEPETESGYAVSYLDAEPEGGWTDLYRTTKLAMRLIAPGTFTIANSTEVTLTKPYYIGVFETTQRQWELVMGDRPSYFTNDLYYATRPVECVSYNMIRGAGEGAKWPATNSVDEASFMGGLRQKSGIAAFDLPTEAQWAYACRAGTTSRFNNGGETTDDMNKLGRYVGNVGADGKNNQNCATNAGTATVGSYLPNNWGLYDMHGNVCEWCLDWYGKDPPEGIDPVGPEGPASNASRWRELRNGGWNHAAGYCTSYTRSCAFSPAVQSYYGGFRLVRALSGDAAAERGAEAAAGAERAGTVCAGVSAPIAVGMKHFADTDIRLTAYDAPYDGQPHTIGVETNEAIADLELRYCAAPVGSGMEN